LVQGLPYVLNYGQGLKQLWELGYQEKKVFQQPLILDFGLIAAMQCKTNNCFIPFLLCLKPSFVYIVYKILEW
jgi:hypothetical protein